MQEVLTCSLEDGVALRKMTAIVGHLILQVVSQSLTLLTCKATYPKSDRRYGCIQLSSTP